MVVTRPLLTRPEVTCYLHIVPVTHYLGIRLEVESLQISVRTNIILHYIERIKVNSLYLLAIPHVTNQHRLATQAPGVIQCSHNKTIYSFLISHKAEAYLFIIRKYISQFYCDQPGKNQLDWSEILSTGVDGGQSFTQS